MEEIDKIDQNRLLGFEYEGSFSSLLEKIKDKNLKTELLQKRKEYKKFDAKEFEKSICKFAKNNNKVRVKTHENNQKTIIVDAISHQDLTATERAYYYSFNINK